MSMLTPDDFTAFFEAVYGYAPFPWQARLASRVASTGEWPAVLDLPTGSGKTATIDIAVFHLALEAERGHARRAPVRIAFVVDRRLVVNDAFERARKIAKKLDNAEPGSVLARAAERLGKLSGDGRPLIVRRMRGGMPREDDWARTPAQPTILCSTVDQVGSRLLFRGYGVSDRMKPIHAGLIGSDCLMLLDEAHLAEPFRQTLRWVAHYRSEQWRDDEAGHPGPRGCSLLTATPGEQVAEPFGLDAQDYANETLASRLAAEKPARLIGLGKSSEGSDEASDAEEVAFLRRMAAETESALAELRETGVDHPAIGVVVNRVGRARAVFKQLEGQLDQETTGLILMIGPARPVDRDEIVKALDPIRTGAGEEERKLDKALIIVATQCIEAGVDIDLDALITEAAPLDALRQRFGRLNRAGREIEPYAAILATKSVLGARYDDPVYGTAIKPAWEYLTADGGKKKDIPIIDFGLNAFRDRMQEKPLPDAALSPKDAAPVLMPAHLDLLSQTSPIPAADPEVALYLHGTRRRPDSVTLVWRADIDPEFQGDDDRVRRLLLLVPPRAAEAIELPRWAVQRWLKEGARAARSKPRRSRVLEQLADIPVAEPDDEARFQRGDIRRVFRWKGDDQHSTWIDPDRIGTGDTIVVPANYGGMDEFGWNPGLDDSDPVVDRADKAAEPFSGRRFAVRVAPGLLGETMKPDMLADALAAAPSRRWQDLRNAIVNLPLPENLRDSLARLDHANGGARSIKAYDDLYGEDEQDRPRGVVFVALFGLRKERRDENGQWSTTEDDAAGSMPGFPLTLDEHSTDVEGKAEEFARLAGLPEKRVTDLKLAGYLHDAGKVDERFQAWLHYGDPLGPDPDDPRQVLAKSDRALPSKARKAASLPPNWRHEAFSVRLAAVAPRFAEANDPELVLWLVGTHHGFGRPFFPHHDPEDEEQRVLPPVLGLPAELAPGQGPQSLGFDWHGLDWASLFERLKARYGVWELARMEAILRLADHRASEEAAERHIAKGDTQ